MVIPKESSKSSQNSNLKVKEESKVKKASSSQQRVTDEDFEMLLNDKGNLDNKKKSTSPEIEEKKIGSSKIIDDDEFDSLLNSSSNPQKPGITTPSYQVEMNWKVVDENTGNDEYDEDGREEENSMEDSFDDVNAAFNFTDTEFDANNRDDYTVATEILLQKQVSLDEIKEEEDESEETEHKKKCSIEIKVLEAKLKELEAIQRSKWNKCLLEMNETTAKSIYDFICSKFDDFEDDKMEENIEEVQNFIAAHGIHNVESVAFELFTLWNFHNDSKAIKEEYEKAKERFELL